MKRTRTIRFSLLALFATVAMVAVPAYAQQKKPNILVIWGDDIGHDNISAYNRGMLDYNTPNIDRIAKEGALFTDHYAQQSCTAGRASFALGQNPFRTGLLTIGMPGSPHGVRPEDPTIAELLKNYGYMNGQFGKNHLGDLNKYLPTVRGFDEFYGNLYHLNAEEEPENPDYPKTFDGKDFRATFGPRGVMDCVATTTADTTVEPRWGVVGKQKCKDTGPLTIERMTTIEKDITARALDFMERAAKANKDANGEKPFFMWFNSTRAHVWIHLSKEQDGKTGKGMMPDVMDELDWETGQLLDKLDQLGIADNTIVLWSTDNGTEIMSTPEMGGMHAFRGEKGLTSEGGFRVPQLMRWPGQIKPGTIVNDITSHDRLDADPAGGRQRRQGHRHSGGLEEGRLHGRRQDLQGASGRLQPATPADRHRSQGRGSAPGDLLLHGRRRPERRALGQMEDLVHRHVGKSDHGLEEIPELAHYHEPAPRSLRAIPGPVRNVSPLVRQAHVPDGAGATTGGKRAGHAQGVPARARLQPEPRQALGPDRVRASGPVGFS